MKRQLPVILVVLLIASLFSCTPAYIPNSLNTPLFSNKNEFHLALNGGTNGFDVQLAYSPTDFLGVMVNGSIENKTDSNGYHKHKFIETGVGYYRPFGPGRFEVYAGYGFGSVDATFKNSLFQDKANAFYHRIFIQPAIGISTAVFDASFAPRFVFVNMHLNGTKYESFNTGNLDPYFEPVVTLKAGYKYVKFVAQIGMSFILTNREQLIYEYKPLIFNMGVQMRLGTKWKIINKTTE